MMRLRRFILLLSCAATLSGCNTMAHMAWTTVFKTTSSPFKKSEQRRQLELQRKHLDGLWEQGYGFNNPNADRIRNGEETDAFFK